MAATAPDCNPAGCRRTITSNSEKDAQSAQSKNKKGWPLAIGAPHATVEVDSMDVERYQRVKKILAGALERDPDTRGGYLARECAGDEDLRAEVDALLAEETNPAAIVDEGLIEPSAGRALANAVRAFLTSAAPATDAAQQPISLPWLQPGATIEQFELIREIGRGGLGQVFLARDTKLGRKVALKFLVVSAPKPMQRLLVEARATAQCHHENIVVVHQIGEAHSIPYLALEYLDGEPLSKLMKSGPLSAERAVELIAPVVRALVCAHDAGIVHRDLKPDNVFVTRSGLVKVLDFGIAKLFEPENGATEKPVSLASAESALTQRSGFLGTPAYMSPEQWGAGDIDHRTDLWSVGLILWQMLAGQHPVQPTTTRQLWQVALRLNEPMPDLAAAAPSVPPELARLVRACLVKDKDHRLGSAKVLLQGLERATPRPADRRNDDICPFPGMSSFQELDADRFFGRQRDVEALRRRLEDEPLVTIIGPSGVGKSSFMRAGVIPALKRSHDAWDVFVIRPARDPVAALITTMRAALPADDAFNQATDDEVRTRLNVEPGWLGAVLRRRARDRSARALIYVDQFEELYTQVEDPEVHRTYTACLSAAADDPSAPLRVVLSLRSDHLERVAEDRAFLDRLSPGLAFLPPLDRSEMHQALVEPVAATGFAFETPVVEEMLDALEGVQSALPLLQFTAARMWDKRDVERRLLTAHQYRALGGVAGTLAAHADALVASLTPSQQQLLRQLLLRLVTSEGTRALVDVRELEALGPAPQHVSRLIATLVRERLVVVHAPSGGDAAAVELIHESLIDTWPALRRWLESAADDAAFLEQLRWAAKQWNHKNRTEGLLWRGEAAEEARRFRARYRGDLTTGERAFLDAIDAMATRDTRRNRRAVAAAFTIMAALVVAALVAVVWIRGAERIAQEQRRRAENEALRSRTAAQQIERQLKTIKTQKDGLEKAKKENDRANVGAQNAREQAEQAEQARRLTYEQLRVALAEARRLAQSEGEARAEAVQLNREKQARIQGLEEELRRLATRLD